MKKTMGETIAELRKNRGMTQKELAEQMNVTDKAVSKWERDLSCPDIHSIPRLAEVLEVSVEELMHVTQTEKKPNDELAKALSVALKAIPMAMGIAVVVGGFLGKLDPAQGLNLLGVGMFCLALNGLKKE